MRISFMFGAFVLLAPCSFAAQDQTAPPDATVTAQPSVIGKGVQIYRCVQQQGVPLWAFVAPEASLYAGSEIVGTHGAGPTWRWKDGSAVTGKLLVSQPSPDHASIPWLLLAATPTVDTKADGALARVAYVRRSETHGGVAPANGCSAVHINAEARVPYEATYTFYTRSAPSSKTAH